MTDGWLRTSSISKPYFLLLVLTFVTTFLLTAFFEGLIVGLLWSAFRGGFSEYLHQLLDAIRWSRGSDDSFWGYLLRIFVVAPYSVLTLITFSAYDSRWVDRKKVDDRVWRRQLLRRRQILRAWHRDHNLDEVHR